MRGENAAVDILLGLPYGSPPRAWGELVRAVAVRVGLRITPTCVGRTHRLSPGIDSRPDHPHVRGENAIPSEEK